MLDLGFYNPGMFFLRFDKRSVFDAAETAIHKPRERAEYGPFCV